jgi:endoglycosylceramidase
MWAGAEPVRGVYNETYFDIMHTLIQKLADRGIYTLVDVHQDVLAKQFCGNGAPDVR